MENGHLTKREIITMAEGVYKMFILEVHVKECGMCATKVEEMRQLNAAAKPS